MSVDSDDERSITPNSGVRLSVGLIAGVVVGFAYFLYARDEYFSQKNEIKFEDHEQNVSREISEIKTELKTKAATTATEDKFFRRDFEVFEKNHIREREQFKESIESKFELIDRKNEIEHRALREKVDHLEDDLESSEKRIDMHYLSK